MFYLILVALTFYIYFDSITECFSSGNPGNYQWPVLTGFLFIIGCFIPIINEFMLLAAVAMFIKDILIRPSR